MAVPKVIADNCTGCEACVDACPVDAISMKDGIAVIDEGECTECSACLDVCPTDAIVEE